MLQEFIKQVGWSQPAVASLVTPSYCYMTFALITSPLVVTN